MLIRWSAIACLASIIWCFQSCKSDPAVIYKELDGKTMGTTYHITYFGASDYQAAIDSLLKVINQEVSTYIPTSTISQFNQADSSYDLGLAAQDTAHPQYLTRKHFIINFLRSKEIFELSKGAFDPTVMPLVNYWGFGYTPEKRTIGDIDSLIVDSLLQYVGFSYVAYDNTELVKDQAGVQLDFSAIAKGYAVDELGRFLESRGVRDYMVEIGGEVRARGKNEKGEFWNLGINLPNEDAALEDLIATVRLPNLSLATSGNYRNYYEIDGVKYSHTINPFTGFPERNNLLSASIFFEDCMTADALATTCMVMGYEKAVEFIDGIPGAEAYFVYGNSDGKIKTNMTEGLKSLIKE